MDLNQKYFEYQKAMIEASAAPDSMLRELYLERAIELAGQIGCFQSKLGAAAACAWRTMSKREFLCRASLPGTTGQDL